MALLVVEPLFVEDRSVNSAFVVILPSTLSSTGGTPATKCLANRNRWNNSNFLTTKDLPSSDRGFALVALRVNEATNN